ncbi:hypothetical protein PMAYCL1PPCAC_07039 [Pristionchus mayeri]|uniref:Uncharacterized protein n=1 Tax=Pristionchus mayeri TaxID=1317129 RepID=A0AAN5CC40_9BILA|nr:hypothetical protein PMAYCL1PPCAC_07039 [Pristionchus mayeri]
MSDPAAPPQSGTTHDAAPSAPPSRNPGSYDELHRRAQDVFPMVFEGCRVAVQKGLSQHFQVSHTLNISPNMTGYKFGATYVGSNVQGPGEAYPVILGDTDASGNTTATVLHQFGPKWRTKLQAQIQKGEIAGAQGSFERKTDLYTAGITLANTNILNDSGVFVAQYLRKLTDKLDVGMEYMNSYGPRIPGGSFSVLSTAARYTTANWAAALAFSKHSTHISYFHKQAPNLAFGVEFTANAMHGDAVTTLAYQAELPDEGVTFRASVDTNWTVAGVMEKRLSQTLPFTIALSGMLNHQKNAGKFGMGLIIG